MSIYGASELFIGDSAQAAFDALAQRTRAMADMSQLRLFERQAVRSMAGVANDTSRASTAYKITLSEAAIRLFQQKSGISTSQAVSKRLI
ncbi:MAG: hypothetical protein HQL93_03370 [Magnetococcales bacterium]|nr:hypothetical protein [Magnetococcales bacterium]